MVKPALIGELKAVKNCILYVDRICSI